MELWVGAALASHSWSSKVEADTLSESFRIDELVTEERNFDSRAAHALRSTSMSPKPLRLSTSSTTFARHRVPSAGAKNSGDTANDCSGPSKLRTVGRDGNTTIGDH